MKVDSETTESSEDEDASNPMTVAVAGTTAEEDGTVSNPMTADGETVAAVIGIVPSATTQTSPSEPNATGAENHVVTLPRNHATTVEATVATVETTEGETGSARKGAEGRTNEVGIGIAPSATIRISPSGRNATGAVSPEEKREAALETIDGVDLTVVATIAVVVSSGETTVAMETAAATNPSQAIGRATIAAPTISRAGRRATSADRTLRTVAVIDAVVIAEVHARAEASEAGAVVAVIDEDLDNNAVLEATTVVDHNRTVISGREVEERATVVATIAEAQGKTVEAVGRAAFDQKGPSVRHKEKPVDTLTTVGQNPFADHAVTTIEGGAHG